MIALNIGVCKHSTINFLGGTFFRGFFSLFSLLVCKKVRPEIRVQKKQMKCLVKETERKQSQRQASIDSLYLSLTEETSTRLTFHNATTGSPWNDVWETTSDWPCPHGKFASANQKLYPDLQGGISALLSQRSFCGETSSGIANVGCFLRLVTRFEIHLHIRIIVNLPP